MSRWSAIQEIIRTCHVCQSTEAPVFAPFNGDWPTLPEPCSKAVLFISEAPPPEGGFWTMQPRHMKQDDLREKLLRLLDLSPSGLDCGLTAFRDSGCYLLQAFPRPLKKSISDIGPTRLKGLLDHQIKTHLHDQIELIQPSAVLALGVPAAMAVSMLWPKSRFAHSFGKGDDKLKAVHGKIFEESCYPILSATYLPSGNGRFRKEEWKQAIPNFIEKVRSQA